MGTDLHLSLEVQTCTLTTPHQKTNKQKTQVHRDVSVFRHGGMLFSPATFVDG